MKTLTNISSIIIAIMCLLGVFTTSLWAQEVNLDEAVRQARQSGIDQETVQQIRQRATQKGMPEQHIVDILQMATELSNDKLPYDLVIQKTLEGISKGVPSDRLVSVLEQVRSHTKEMAPVVQNWMQAGGVPDFVENRGQDMSGEAFRNNLISSASRVRMQGVSREIVETVLTDLADPGVLSGTAPSNIVAAVGILPDLAAGIERPQQASAFIVRAIKGGFGANELQKLPAAMNMARMRSQLPAATVMEGVANQLQNGIPASQILKNLFDGKIGAGPPGNIPPGMGRSGQGGGGAVH